MPKHLINQYIKTLSYLSAILLLSGTLISAPKDSKPSSAVPLRPINLINNFNFIKEIDFDKKLLRPDGTLSDTTLPQFLAKAFTEQKLDKRFSQANCLKVKSLPIVGSFNTKQLFIITSSCDPTQGALSFIGKEARSGLEEAISLNEIGNFPTLKVLQAPKTPPAGELSLALPIAYLSYYDGDNQQRFLSIMPLARGRVLCDVVKDFRNDQSPQNAERIRKLYKNLGTQLGHFHKRNMKPGTGSPLGQTALHGDLHCLNAFYDEGMGVTTLIDNETIAYFLKNPSRPDDDLLKLFLGLNSTSEPSSRTDMITGIDLKTWYDLAFDNFVTGYANAFPGQQKEVYKELKRMFNSDFQPVWMNIPPEKLKTLREKYINPILDKKAAS